MNDQNKQRDEMDRMVDATLSRYASVEPRPGLEQRILANLNRASSQPERRIWWHWTLVAAAAAAVLVVIVSVAWRAPRTALVPIAGHTSAPRTVEAPPKQATVVAHVQPRPEPPTRSPRHIVNPKQAVASAPKLDRFPSPRPLNEQEQILASYVEAYPDKAVLVARAQTEMDRLDREEELRIQGPSAVEGPARTEN